MSKFLSVSLSLLEGFATTCLIFLLTLLLAIPLGMVITLGSRSRIKAIALPCRALVWVVRGTPLMLQLIAIFYGPALLFGIVGFDRFAAVLVAFTLNYACYFSEIYRGGMDNIPRGQREAGLVLGMTRIQIFFHVTLPQLIKRILAPMSNEVMSLVKDTSLARIISVSEIIFVAQEYTRQGLIYPLFYTGAFYLLFIGILTLLFRLAEKKTAYIKV